MRKKPRRQYGSGSVYRTGDGRFRASIEAGFTTSGGRRRIVVSGTTEAEVRSKLKDKQRQIAAEGVPTASARTTVKAWAEEWLEVTKTQLRPKPWATDASAVRRWIVPAIGHKRLEDLSPADMRAVAQAQRDAGRSTSTANRTHSTLTGMLRAAILEGHQVPRRVLDVKAPALAVNDRTAMDVSEVMSVLQAASFLPHGSRWAMAFLHGPRQGECLGLVEDCVDLDVGLVRFEWQLQSLPYNVARDRSSGFRVPDGYEVRQLVGAYHLVRPKSKSGFRVATLVPAMVEALADWLAIRPANPWGLVWPTATGRPMNAADDRDEWYQLQESVDVRHPSGRPYYVHEARHTTATQLLEAGVDPKQITTIMGHSSILTTQGYQHPSRRAALSAVESVAAALLPRTEVGGPTSP